MAVVCHFVEAIMPDLTCMFCGGTAKLQGR